MHITVIASYFLFLLLDIGIIFIDIFDAQEVYLGLFTGCPVIKTFILLFLFYYHKYIQKLNKKILY